MIKFNDILKENKLLEKYPTVKWVKSELYSRFVHLNRKSHVILSAYIVGSEAKGTAKKDSDLDIAVIIEPIKGKTALQFSEQFHIKCAAENQDFEWNGRVVDFQFFYKSDPELSGYSKISLKQ